MRSIRAALVVALLASVCPLSDSLADDSTEPAKESEAKPTEDEHPVLPLFADEARKAGYELPLPSARRS